MALLKRVPKRKPARREIEPKPVYEPGWPFFRTEFAGWDVPETIELKGERYYRYKTASLRSSVVKLVKQLRNKGYRARVYEVKRRLFGRSIVVNHWIYTKPKYGTL